MEELTNRCEIIEEAATDAILTIAENGTILSISRAAERIFGHSIREMVGQPVERIVPGYKEHTSVARRRDAPSPVLEVAGIHKTGKQVQVELSLGEYKKHNKHIYTAVIR